MARPPLNDQRAFTLLEIMAALGIVAVIFFIFNHMSRSLKAQGDVFETRSRMEEIVDEAKVYYTQHGDLPRVRSDGGIPLRDPENPDAGYLDVDPRLRFDSWQRPLRYISHTNDGDSERGRPGEILIDPLSAGAPAGAPRAMVIIPADTRTLLRAIQFEGRRVAGLVISSGPNQEFNYRVEQGEEYAEAYVLDDPSDDIIVPIDLTSEATRMALAELKVLNEKVAALEDRYLGIDNDRDSPPVYDEAGCRGIPYGVNSAPFVLPNPFTNCNQLIIPSTSTVYPPGTTIDINCGKPTLDYMKAHFCPSPYGAGGGCPPGYFRPATVEVPPVPDPNDPGSNCPGTPRPGVPATFAFLDYPARPASDDCYWGLVETQYGSVAAPEPNETDGDQARAFIFCLFGLRPEDVVDPWLNGYVWGCGSSVTYDVRGVQYGGCQVVYAVDDPHHRRFFSAGPDGLPAANTATPAEHDDIIY